MSKVSIIIPCFKQAHYLAQALDSCFAQTHKDLEVIVIDDGSPDDVAAVAAHYQNRPGFRYVRQENAGLGGARNRGISESSGEYLCFLDADDWYGPEKISRQAALLDETLELGWVYCDITSVDGEGQPLVQQYSVGSNKRHLSGDIFGSLLLCGYFQPHTVMVRRTVLDRVGVFDPELGGYADYDLWLRIAALYPVVFIPERLAFYRVHANSMSRDGLHMRATRQGAFRKIVRLHPERVAEGLTVMQQALIDQFETSGWVATHERKARVAETVVASTDSVVVPQDDFTRTWRGKLNAGISMAKRKEQGLAIKMMLDAVKSVETCRNPRIILEALIEVPEHLAPLDPGRAKYLFELGAKLATKIGDEESLRRIGVLMAKMADGPRAKNPAVAAASSSS